MTSLGCALVKATHGLPKRPGKSDGFRNKGSPGETEWVRTTYSEKVPFTLKPLFLALTQSCNKR